jgi:virulence factor BrkB
VAQAFQYAMNTVWGLPRNSRPNPLKARGRSLLLLASGGLAVMGTTVLSIVGASGAGAFRTALRLAALAASVVINIAVFVFGFRFATARRLSVRDVAPGAIHPRQVAAHVDTRPGISVMSFLWTRPGAVVVAGSMMSLLSG